MTQEQKLELFEALGRVCSDLKEQDDVFTKHMETDKSVELRVDNLKGVISHWNSEHSVPIHKYFGDILKEKKYLGRIVVSKIFDFQDAESCMQYLGKFYVNDFSGRLDIMCIESDKNGYPKHEDVLVPKNGENPWNLTLPVSYPVSALVRRKAKEWNKIQLHHVFKEKDDTIYYDTYGYDVSVSSSELVYGNEVWLKDLMNWANGFGVSVKNIYWFGCANGQEARLKCLEDDTYTMVIL